MIQEVKLELAYKLEDGIIIKAYETISAELYTQKCNNDHKALLQYVTRKLYLMLERKANQYYLQKELDHEYSDN